MADPFLSEIRVVSFNFAPRGWAMCNGQILPINQNQALFALLGTTYGGDGRVNFALPDFRGRAPIHVGNGHILGERAGAQVHTLSASELPQHIHLMRAASTAATSALPGGNVLATTDPTTFGSAYASPGGPVAMAPESVGNVGGSQAHTNMQPFIALTFVIALQGIFPSRN